ncbi:lipid A deacylase [Ferrigenium kumadai]|uniref:Lipid A deacylase n=1 Tax=Ferrigenium kumadai TaxID=1682490 RepID=A0AAN1VZF2_9PROT|nr:acyloxyacyl hydrolase [Ferrigenium kumadai]BBI99275.1 lipid A deacylase [Ferrigenium kumadai]
MRKVGLLLGAMLFSGSVLAVDGVSVEYGKGNATEMARVGALWNWDKQWFTEGNWLVTGFWEASVGSWRGKSAIGNNQTITDVGVTPVFRLQQKNPVGFAPYAEGAIGFHLITPTFIYANRHFGSSFQFGDHLGVGVRFGDHQQFDLGYRYQHLSNGGIKKPNQGINFNQVRFTYHF